MRFLMMQKLVAPRVRGRTLRTLERLDLAVHLRMPQQIGARRKRPGTQLAHVRLQSAVDSQVLGQIGVARKVLAAHRTAKRPNACVHNRVLPQVRSASESLFAHDADKRLLRLVALLDVRHDAVSIGAAKRTKVALMRIHRVVAALVVEAILLVHVGRVAKLAKEQILETFRCLGDWQMQPWNVVMRLIGHHHRRLFRQVGCIVVRIAAGLVHLFVVAHFVVGRVHVIVATGVIIFVGRRSVLFGRIDDQHDFVVGVVVDDL